MRSPRPEAVLPAETSDDEFLGGQLRLLQPLRGHRAGFDSILLAAAAPACDQAIDLGAGIGAAGLALLARGVADSVTLVEIDPSLASLAETNANRNGLGARAHVVVADVATLARRGGPEEPAAGRAALVVMNPPFNDPARRRASPDPRRRRAHAAKDNNLAIWVQAANRLLRADGRLVLVHRPEALAAILAALDGRFGAVEIVPVHAKPRGPAIRVIVRAGKGKRGLPSILAGFVLADADGRPSAQAEAVLRNGSALATG